MTFRDYFNTMWILKLLLLMIMFDISGALMCYQCASTGNNGDCINNIEGLVNASTTGMNKYRYTNNCTDSKPSWDRCVLEVHKGEKDAITLFLRGCHDGKHFNPSFKDKRFEHLTPDNKTTCAQKEQLICFTFCDTDYCNGPKPRNLTDWCEGEGYNSSICDGNRHQQHWLFTACFIVVTFVILSFLQST